MGSNERQFVIVMMMLVVWAAVAEAQANFGCHSCGNLSVPYPFGTEKGCYMDDYKFFIRCEAGTGDTAPKAFLQNSNISVNDIYLDGQLRVSNMVAFDCYDSSGNSENSSTWFGTARYNISSTRNKFTAIGCDTVAVMGGSIGQTYGAACITICNKIADVDNGSCSGTGCCQADIPRGVRDYNIILDSLYQHAGVLSFNPCSYGFVVEDGNYSFSISELNETNLGRKYPMILDWTIGDHNCKEAVKDPESYACKENSTCYEPEYGNGYLCKCRDGFQGNPYLSNNCQDMNECEVYKPCNISTSRCHNTEGSYYCSCLEGYEGNDQKNGSDCKPKINPGTGRIFVTQIALGISVGFLALFFCISWSFWVFRQRKFAKLREQYFKQNGGILLREKFSKREGYGENIKIFAAEELEKATNNYHESRILGQGGQGTVYKGILADNRMVAIKRSRIGDQSQVEPFINEISVLYQINHRNVVKLLGCCLETPVPHLVYEYVTKGSLFDHMHDVAPASFLPWETRLRIATETAEALSYLHSAASIPIIHRDIKLANILLDEHYTAKISDFGASRLIPSDEAQVTTIVQGTFGYLDPEYMQTGQLTEKSDVYSFGVVLVELLTGKKAVSYGSSEEKKLLARYFVSLMKEERLPEILDPRLSNDVNVDHLKEVAALAWRCLRVKGEERPTMKEVAHELAGLQATSRHPWGKSNLGAEEESQYLLGKLCSPFADGASGSSILYDSIRNQVAFELEGAR